MWRLDLKAFLGVALATACMVGCGPRPEYKPLSSGEVGDLRSAVGENRTILDVSEYGETIHFILEFPRDVEISQVGKECTEAVSRIQQEVLKTPHSERPVVVWGHSEPNADATFRLLGYAQTSSASDEIVWEVNTQLERELPLPKSRQSSPSN